MAPYISIEDRFFDRPVTLREAYRIMERMVTEHLERGEASTLDLVSYLGVSADGVSADPAAIYDFLRIANEVAGVGVPSGQ